MASYSQRRTALLWCAILLVPKLSFAGLSLQSLQSTLSAKKAGWQAGHTSVSSLPESEIKKMLGANLPTDSSVRFSAPKDDLPFPFPFPFPMPDQDQKNPSTKTPSSLDWRNHNGINYSSPLLDQGRCGSCVAFAVVSALETQMNISRNAPFSPWAFSPQHLFSCGGGFCERGWTPAGALNYLQKNGIPDESCFPYESGIDGKDLACNRTCNDHKDRSEGIAGYTTEAFFFKSTPKLKQALTKGPLVATMMVFEDFIYYKGGVYEHTTGKKLGGHAVTIEGFDDKEGAFIVRNSWGPTWGENGYFRIKYDDESDIGANAYSIQVGNGNGFVTAKGVRDDQVVSGSWKLDLHSTYPGTSKIAYQLIQGPSPVADGFVTSNSSTIVDTQSLADGTYLLRTSAVTNKGIEAGQDRHVHILNGALKGSVEFTNLKNGESISGEKTLEIEIKSQPILPTELTFFFKELKTGEENFRTTHAVGSKMNLNWRTDPRPKGDYEIWLEAKAGKQTLKSNVLKVTLK